MIKSSGKRLQDHYGEDLVLFEQIIGWASQNTEGPVENQFVSSARLSLKKWGGNMFWSDKQNNWICKIADKVDGKYVEFENV